MTDGGSPLIAGTDPNTAQTDSTSQYLPPSTDQPAIAFANASGNDVSVLMRHRTSIRDMLNEGVINPENLRLADQLLMQVDPDVAGVVTEKTKNVPHTFEDLPSNVGGQTQLAFTRFTKGSEDDTTGMKIIFPKDPYYKTPPDIVVHERVHAIPVHELPKVLKELIPTEELSIPDQNAPLYEIFTAVLKNGWWGEVPAYASQVLFADSFSEVYEENYFSFRSTEQYRERYTDHKERLKAEGGNGLYKWVSGEAGYQHYKIISLIAAISIKQGMLKEPTWEDILRSLDVEKNKDGAYEIKPEKLSALYSQYVEPFLNLGMIQVEDFKLILKAGRYFVGHMSKDEQIKFLKNDFDSFTILIARLMGEDIQIERKRTVTTASINLPNRPTPITAGDPTELITRPEVAANKVEALGKYTETLRDLSLMSDEYILDNLSIFLHYAEKSDPETSAKVYGRLISIIGNDDASDNNDSFSTARKWEIGLSLVGASRDKTDEYYKAGLRLIDTAVTIYERGNGLNSMQFYSTFTRAIELKVLEPIERILDITWESIQEDIKKFEAEIDNAGEELTFNAKQADACNGIKRFLSLVGEITPPYDDEQLSESIKTKLRERLKVLWPIASKWTNKKIEVYQRTYAPELTTYTSLDELTAVNPRWDHFAGRDIDRLVGGPNDRYDIGAQIISLTIFSASLTELALDLIKDTPQSSVKLKQYEHLFGRYMSPELKLRAYREYAEALEKQEAGIRAWAFIERDSSATKQNQIKYREKATAVDYKTSHYFVHNMIEIAEMLTSVRATESKKEHAEVIEHGLAILRELPEAKAPIFGVNNFYYTREYYIPAIMKAVTLITYVDRFPETEKEEILRHAFHLLSGTDTTECADSYIKSEYLLRLINLSIGNGFLGLTGEILSYWESGFDDLLKKDLIRQPVNDIDPENPGHHPLSENINESIHNVNFSIPFSKAISKKGHGLKRLVERVTYDVQQNRNYFSVESVLEGIKLLGKEKIFSIIPNAREHLMDLTRAVIDHYVSSLGTNQISYFLNSLFQPLVSNIIELSLPNEDKDELIVYMIEKILPEKGLVAKGSNGSEGLLNAGQLINEVVGNKDLPRAEALLMDRAAKALRDLNFTGSDPRGHALLRGLDWAMERLGNEVYLDPANADTLKALRHTPYYTKMVDALTSFSRDEAIRVIDTQDILKNYGAAIQAADAQELAKQRPAIKQAITQELAILREDLGNTLDQTRSLISMTDENVEVYVPYSNISVGIIGRIYKDWKTARKNGGWKIEKELFELWAISKDKEEAILKRALYYQELIDPELPLEIKRRIYEQVLETEDVSRYAKHIWEKIVKNGNRSREDLFYRTATPILHDPAFGKNPVKRVMIQGELPVYVRLIPDKMLALAIERPSQKSRKFVERLMRYRRYDSNSWKMDPANMDDWHIMTTFIADDFLVSARLIKNLFGLLTIIAVGKYPDMEPMVDTLRAQQYVDARSFFLVKRLQTTVDTYYQKVVTMKTGKTASTSEYSLYEMADFAKHLERIPSAEEAGELMGRFNTFLREEDKADTDVKLRLFEIPPAFKDRHEIIRFLLSIFYFTFDVGEQNKLLKSMDGVSDDVALTTFMKETAQYKLAQSIATWPEVSADIRAEFTSLHDQVPPSDLEEVRTFLNDQLKEGPDREAILANLGRHRGNQKRRKALGSGTVGEVFWSKLADGTEVAVKLIPPTKEAGFRRMMDKYREVQYILELYFNEKPWARRAHRWISTFLAMAERELNLSNEASVMDAVATRLPQGIKIASYKKGLLNEGGEKKVLIQTFMRGKKITKIADQEVKNRAIDTIREYLMNEIMESGLFHPDLHPGNILIASDGTIIILDWGQIGMVSVEDRAILKEFLTACFVERNSAKVVVLLEQMGDIHRTNIKKDDLAKTLDAIIKSEMNGQISHIINEIFDTAYNAGIMADPTYLMLLKGVFTFENTAADVKAA